MLDYLALGATEYWLHKSLADMNPEQWEALCDRCAKCCLVRLEDEEDGEIYTTNLACKLLDVNGACCTDYSERQRLVPECLSFDANMIASLDWLPNSCSYKRVAQGLPLDVDHPLLTGTVEGFKSAGKTVIGKIISETDVDEADYEEHIIQWWDED